MPVPLEYLMPSGIEELERLRREREASSQQGRPSFWDSLMSLYNAERQRVSDRFDYLADPSTWRMGAPPDYHTLPQLSPEQAQEALGPMIEEAMGAAMLPIPGVLGMIRRTLPPPSKTVPGFKLFDLKRSKPGELFPTQIGKSKGTVPGVWMDAEDLPTKGFAARPGLHMGDVPHAPQMLTKSGQLPPNRVWATTEMPADIPYQHLADVSPTRDLPKLLPKEGHYTYRVRPDALPWTIGGSMKVGRVLDDAEVEAILRSKGIEPPTRIGGPINLKDWGF